MPANQRTRPLSNCFKVTIDGLDISTWRTVGGLELSVELLEEQTGSFRMPTIQAATMSYSDITLAWGFGKMDLYKWFDDICIKGKSVAENTKNGSVALLAQDLKTEIALFEFTNSWPKSLAVSDVKADASEVMVETLVLSVETLKRTK